MSQVTSTPDMDPKAALQWLAQQRKSNTRFPFKTVEYGELVLEKAGLLTSLPQEELWSFLEQVGIAAIELGRWDLAEVCISRLESRFPQSARVKSLKGMLFEGKGEFSKALEFYENELIEDGTNIIISKRLVATLKAMPASHPRGGTKGAIEALVKHLDTFYQDPEGWQELAELYAEIGLYQQSIFALEELMLLEPQNSFFQLKLAETLFTAGHLVRAYKAYLRVLEMCNSDKDINEGGKGNGPWVRGLWGLKVTTRAILAKPSLLSAPSNDSPTTSHGTEDVKKEKVQAIDQLVTSLLLDKVYSPASNPTQPKEIRDVVRSVLGAQ